MKRAIVTALGLIVVLTLTLAVFGVPPLQGLGLIYEGAFGDKFGLSRTLVRTTPLLLCGLGVAVAWRAGMYNIGGEGQYVTGGVAGAWVAQLTSTYSAQLGAVLVLLGAVCGGAILAAFAGWLQVKRGVQCVISTILINFIAIQLLGWAVRGPLQEHKHQLPQSEPLTNAAMLQRFDPQTDLHSGVGIALIAAIVVSIGLKGTVSGFKLKVVGESERLARSQKLNPGSIQIGAMAVSGALCGLAGGLDYVGLIGHVGDGFAQGWGFLAIPVALLGGLDPVGVGAAALYFGALMAGGEGLSRFSATGTTLVYVIQSVAVLGLVAINSFSRRSKVVVD